MSKINLSASLDELFPELDNFLLCKTSDSWVAQAIKQTDILLIDHANCEKKAAWTAVNLTFKYIQHDDLLNKMSRLAREELLHFEQVLALMKQRNIEYRFIPASRYAKRMHESIRRHEPDKLIDTLIVGAFIEARSCERFHKLSFHVDPILAKFYRSLLRSEGRHFIDYLTLAQQYAQKDLTDRIALFAQIDCLAVQEPDEEFRFHSGLPAY